MDSDCSTALAREIAASGPISLDRFMGEANRFYYAAGDPLGAAGDFITAPEISQMFGELIGLWLADLWIRTGKSGLLHYVELGPGRGTLAADALRAMERNLLAPKVHFIETSPVLRERQIEAVSHASQHEGIESLPTDAPLLVVANEFFDALPIRQIVRTEEGWRERMVGHDGARFAPVAGNRNMEASVPPASRGAPEGAIVEIMPAAADLTLSLGHRIRRQGGAMLVIDYGYEGPAVGDTLQALRRHQMTDPFEHVGTSDLTAHVDFTALANVGRAAELAVHGPTGQGAFLARLGIYKRAETLAEAQPERRAEIEAARERLIAPEQMGALFKAMALVHPDWPAPEGFDAG